MTADGVHPAAAATFRDVLEGELMAGAGTRFLPASGPCRDVPCARSAGAYTGAVVVVFGMLRPLGTRIVAQVTMVHGPSGTVLATASGSAEAIERLDEVAKSLASTLLARNRGAVVQPPVQSAMPPPPRPEQESTDQSGKPSAGFLMRVGGIRPLGDSYGGLGMGMLFDIGVWIEGTSFAVEPRIGFRFDTSTRDDASYFAMPMDLGGYFVPDLGDVRPFVGGGLGFRYLSEKRSTDVQIGSVIISEHRGEVKQDGTGLGAFGRAGVVLLANSEAHLILCAEYDVSFVELGDSDSAKAFAFGLAVVL